MGQGVAVSMRMMKFGLLAGLAALVAACSSAPSQEQNTQQAFGMAKGIWAQYKAPPPSGMPQFTRGQIEAATQQLLLFEIESDKRGAAAGLVSTNGGVHTFASGDGAALMLRQGVVVSTRGFGMDMMSSSGPSVAQIRKGQGAWTRSYQHLGDDDQILRRQFQCHVERRGGENVTISQKTYATQRYAEICQGSSEQIVNEYWIETSGKVRQSRQWINRTLGMLTIADPM